LKSQREFVAIFACCYLGCTVRGQVLSTIVLCFAGRGGNCLDLKNVGSQTILRKYSWLNKHHKQEGREGESEAGFGSRSVQAALSLQSNGSSKMETLSHSSSHVRSSPARHMPQYCRIVMGIIKTTTSANHRTSQAKIALISGFRAERKGR